MTKWMVIVLVALLASCAVQPGNMAVQTARLNSDTPFEAVCALWVTRWDYRTRADVERIVADAADLGVTDLVFQVRGQADAFYASELEPWGAELLAALPDGATEPDFDPLEVVCEAAHARGLRVHAWINVMPLWRTTRPPTNEAHLFHTRPEWRLHDATGEPQPLNDHYVIVNPVLPEVHAYLCDIARDIVMRYPVDGLHLDYIRFVAESMDEDKLYPGDAKSLALFTRATGLKAAEHREAYRDYVRQRITALVRAIRATIKAARPRVVLSAALWRDYRSGRDRYLQDGPAWLEAGLLDLAIPMIYTENSELFAQNLTELIALRHEACMLAGVGVYKHDRPDLTIEQFNLARAHHANGLCLFSYHALFDSQSHEQQQSSEASRQRKTLRDAVRAYLRDLRSGRLPSASAQP